MNSIATRLLVSASLVLAGFVILTSVSVRHSVHTQAEEALFDRLQGLVYGILGASELDGAGELAVSNYELPDQRLTSPVPGTYAEVIALGGKRLWASESTAALIPDMQDLTVGEWRFSQYAENDAEVRSLQFATSWTTDADEEKVFFVQVVDDAEAFNTRLKNFDRNLWIGLLLSALMLLLIQLLVLTWGLNPLSKISRGLKDIESGDAELLDTRLPIELKPLANSVNTLLQSERNRHERYRNVVDDLAHSLKTPLSVMKNVADGKQSGASNSLTESDISTVGDQTRRMQEIIHYHLQRAAARGSQALAPPTSPHPLLQRLGQSLQKVYPDQHINFQFNLQPGIKLRAHESDLLEIFGNVLENCCKYGATVVTVSSESAGNHQILHIDDNGPGFPEAHIESLSARGMRADTRRDGQGLGLSVSRELLESYGGGLKLSNLAHGGARVSMLFTQS